MSDYIRKEASKIVVGERLNDLVLKTLGRVYIETGSKKELLDDLIQRILDASLESSKSSGSNITTIDTEKDLENLTYPGDNQFVFVTDSKNLYITAGGEYIPIVAASDVSIDWANVKGNYVKLTGDTMSGDLTAPNLIAKNQLQSKTYIDAPLKVNSNIMVKNLNSEYLNGKKWDEFARRNEPEQIGGAWNFNNRETFNDTVVFNGNIGSAQFKSGFAGVGWRLNATSNTLTVDNLVVRKTMNVYELVVNKISATNGALWVSDSGKIKSCEKLYPVYNDSMSSLLYTPEQLEYNDRVWIEDVDENGELTGEYVQATGDIILNKTVYIPTRDSNNNLIKRYIYSYYFNGPIYSIVLEDDLTPFRVNDIIRCQQFKDNRVVYYDAVVINTNNCLYIRLYQLGDETVETDIEISDTPAEDQPLVRIGNISDKNRQGAIYLTSSDEDSPFIDIMECINRPDFSTSLECIDEKTGKPYTDSARSMRIGNLEGITDPAFGGDQPKGMGMYAENVYIKGKLIQVEGDEEYFIPIYKGEYSSITEYFYYNYVFYKNKYWLQVNPEYKSVTGVAPDWVQSGFKQTDTQYNQYWQLYMAGADGQDGAPGDDGISSFTSYVFCRYKEQPATPQGGKFSYPYPDGYNGASQWTDGVPDGTDPLWMSYRLFYSDNRTTNDWTTPVCMSSSDSVQIKYSSSNSDPGTPDTKPDLWYDDASSTTIWMAIRKWSDQGWSAWQVSKIKGEDGTSGGIGYSIVLSNETHTLVVDGSGVTTAKETVTCDITVYQLADSIVHRVDVVNTLPTGVTYNIEYPSNSSKFTMTVPKGTSLSNFSVVFEIVINGSVSVRREMTICVVESGKASFVTLSGTQIFIYKKDSSTGSLKSTPIPSSIKLTASPNNCEITGWYSKAAGYDYVSLSSAGVSTTFEVLPTGDYWRGQDSVTFKVMAGDLYDEMTVVKLYDGIDGNAVEGLQGAVIRTTEWAAGVNYKNGTELEDGIKYLDLVTVTNGPNDYSVYQCKENHTSNDNNKPKVTGDTDEWRKMNKMTPIYTPLIFAENAKFYMANTNELAILDSNNNVIAAMSGSNVQGYTFWSGGSTPNTSTFKVDKYGVLTATQAVLEGSFKVKAKNDERSIELCLNEDITRASNEDPVVRITDADGAVVTELNGNEYTSTSDMFDDEAGILDLWVSSNKYTNSVDSESSNCVQTKSIKSNQFVEFTNRKRFTKPINIKVNKVDVTIDPQIWGSHGIWTNTCNNSEMMPGSYALSYVTIRPVVAIYNDNNVLVKFIDNYAKQWGVCRGEYGTTEGYRSGIPGGCKGTSSANNNILEELIINDTVSNYSRTLSYTYSNLDFSYSGTGYASFGIIYDNIIDCAFCYASSAHNEVSTTSCSVAYSMTNAYVDYSISGYASKYFANGLVLGTKTSNGVQMYNVNNYMNVEFSSNGRALKIDNSSMSYKTTNGTAYSPMMFVVGYGKLTPSSRNITLTSGGTMAGSVGTSTNPYVYTFTAESSIWSTLFGVTYNDLYVVLTPNATSVATTCYSLDDKQLIIKTNTPNIDVVIYAFTKF
jgi:hypothetical protein